MNKGWMWIGLCAVVGLIILLAGFAPAQDQNANTGTSMNSNMNANATHKSKHDNTNSNMSANMNTSGSNANTASGLASSDRKFVMEAGMGGMEEVTLGRLATDHAASAEVKQFGQRMVDDHTKAGDQLMQVATQKGITLPTALDAKHQSDVDKLSKLSGADFDRAYMSMMVKDHKKDVKEFQEEANKGQDADVKGFASTTLPTLQDHLRMAEDINGRTSAKSASAAHNMNRPSDMDSNMQGNANANTKASKSKKGNSNSNTSSNANNSNR
jgi:putative membrane protein